MECVYCRFEFAGHFFRVGDEVTCSPRHALRLREQSEDKAYFERVGDVAENFVRGEDSPPEDEELRAALEELAKADYFRVDGPTSSFNLYCLGPEGRIFGTQTGVANPDGTPWGGVREYHERTAGWEFHHLQFTGPVDESDTDFYVPIWLRFADIVSRAHHVLKRFGRPLTVEAVQYHAAKYSDGKKKLYFDIEGWWYPAGHPRR